MNSLKLQIVLATILTMCCFLLVCLMFVYMVEYKGNVERIHAIMGIVFTLGFALSMRILVQCVEQRRAEEEYEQHMIDEANDYASREY